MLLCMWFFSHCFFFLFVGLASTCRKFRRGEKVHGGEGIPFVGRTAFLHGVRAHARAKGRELSWNLDPQINLRGAPDDRQRESRGRLFRPPWPPGQALLRHLRSLPLQWRVSFHRPYAHVGF